MKRNNEGKSNRAIFFRSFLARHDSSGLWNWSGKEPCVILIYQFNHFNIYVYKIIFIKGRFRDLTADSRPLVVSTASVTPGLRLARCSLTTVGSCDTESHSDTHLFHCTGHMDPWLHMGTTLERRVFQEQSPTEEADLLQRLPEGRRWRSSSAGHHAAQARWEDWWISLQLSELGLDLEGFSPARCQPRGEVMGGVQLEVCQRQEGEMWY